jgi:hypothetical protein
MKRAIVLWLLRRLGYPTHKLVEGVPSILAVVEGGQVVYATSQSPHVARAKTRELVAGGARARLILYRAVRVEPS